LLPPTPASTGLITVNSAEPMQIRMFVRRPESLCRHSRSIPTAPPIAQAINSRCAEARDSSNCSTVEKCM
jgi:hypothetical protein